MAILYQTKTAFASGTGALTVAALTGAVADDFILLLVESANEVVNPPSGYTAVTGSPVSTGTAAAAGGVRISVFYRIATGADSTTSIPDSGNHTTAIKFLYRGVDPVNPFAGTPVTSIQTPASTSVICPGITTTHANSRVVHCIGLDLDAGSTAAIGAPTNANLLGLNERHDQTINSGAGGGLALIDGLLETAGASGDTTATGTSSIRVYLTLALRDYVIPGVLVAASINVSATVVASLTVPPPAAEVIATASGGASFTYPGGFAADDIGIVTAFRDDSETPPTVPAGWTTIRTKSNSGCSAVAAYRTLTGAESGSVTFTNAVSTALTIYRGPDPANPIGNVSVSASSGEVVYVPELALAAPQYDPATAVLVGSNQSTAIPDFDYTGTPPVFSPGNAVAWSAALAETETVPHGASSGTVLVQNVGATTIRSSPDGIVWTTRLTTALNVRWVAFGGGLFIVFTTGATYYTSPDGINWTTRTGGWAAARIAKYANSTWVLITGAVNQVYTSTNGTTWTARNLNGTGTALANGPSDVAYASGRWLCCTDQNGYSYSDDNGATWAYLTAWDVGSPITMASMLAVHRIGSINGVFFVEPRVAVRTWYWSANGTAWNYANSVRRPVSTSELSTTVNLKSPWSEVDGVAYTTQNAEMVGTIYVYTRDGQNFYYGDLSAKNDVAYLPTTGTGATFHKFGGQVVLSNGRNYTLYGYPSSSPTRRVGSAVGNSAVALYDSAGSAKQISAGSDVDFSLNWIVYRPTALVGKQIRGIAFVSPFWVVITPTEVWRSSNLETWQQVTAAPAGSTYGRITATSTQVLVSVSSSVNSPSVYYSGNASTWVSRAVGSVSTASPQHIYLEASEDSTTVGWYEMSGKTYRTSVEASGTYTNIVLTPTPVPDTTDPRPFTRANVGHFSSRIGLVTAGNSNSVYHDGWYARAVSTPGSSLTGVRIEDSLTTVCSTDGYIYTTDDPTLIGWNKIDIGATQPLRSLTNNRGYYVTVGDAGTLAYSADRFNWVLATSPLGPTENLLDVRYARGWWIVTGDNGGIAFLRDAP